MERKDYGNKHVLGDHVGADPYFHSLLQLISRKFRRPCKSNTGESTGKGKAIPTNEMEAGFSYGSIAAECHGLLDHVCNMALTDYMEKMFVPWLPHQGFCSYTQLISYLIAMKPEMSRGNT